MNTYNLSTKVIKLSTNSYIYITQMPVSHHISNSVQAEMRERIMDDEELKAPRRTFFGLLFLRRLNRYQPKSGGWLTLTL